MYCFFFINKPQICFLKLHYVCNKICCFSKIIKNNVLFIFKEYLHKFMADLRKNVFQNFARVHLLLQTVMCICPQYRNVKEPEFEIRCKYLKFGPHFSKRNIYMKAYNKDIFEMVKTVKCLSKYHMWDQNCTACLSGEKIAFTNYSKVRTIGIQKVISRD